MPLFDAEYLRNGTR